MTNIPLLDGERIDRLGYQGLQIIQNPTKFKFTIDAFLLAAFVNSKPGHTIIDLGTGNGVIPLLIAGQRPVTAVTGIEIQPDLADMARRSLLLNSLEDRIKILTADLRDLPDEVRPNSFDYVISNPPFFAVPNGVVSPNDALAHAKFEMSCSLADLLKAAARLVRGNGRLAMIYPSSRLGELSLGLAQVHLTPKRLCFIHPRPLSESNLVLLEARPGAKNGLKVLPPLFIYESENTYTETMNQIFHGQVI